MIRVPRDCWKRLLDELERHPDRTHERIAYLDGFRFGTDAVVTTVTIPDADTTPVNYTVPAAAVSEAGQHFRRLGMFRLLQVHTHGGAHVDHSRRDDALAYSQQPDAVSVVLPQHAATRPPPTDSTVGVHVRATAGWIRLSPQEAHDLICLVPSVLDFRRDVCNSSGSPIGTCKTPQGWWTRTFRRLSKWLST